MPFLKFFVPFALTLGLVAAVARGSIFNLKENERLVVFRFGHPIVVRGPGLVLLVPILERGSRFDMADDFHAKVVRAYESQLEETGQL